MELVFIIGRVNFNCLDAALQKVLGVILLFLNKMDVNVTTLINFGALYKVPFIQGKTERKRD